MKYYTNGQSIYRVTDKTFSRWNWDFANWNGNITNHEQRLKQIETLSNGMREITEQQAKDLIVGSTYHHYIHNEEMKVTEYQFNRE